MFAAVMPTMSLAPEPSPPSVAVVVVGAEASVAPSGDEPLEPQPTATMAMTVASDVATSRGEPGHLLMSNLLLACRMKQQARRVAGFARGAVQSPGHRPPDGRR